MADLKRISDVLQQGDFEALAVLTRAALDEGVDAEIILKQALLPGMDAVGERFRTGELFVPDVVFTARAMTVALEILQPFLAKKGIKPIGQVVLGTVENDFHDIGKNLVGMMLAGGGFKVVDLGHDVPVERFIEAARRDPDVLIGISALLTTTMSRMADVVRALREAGLTNVKVMVGGAPVTRAFAERIGAHGYAPDAASAVELAKSLVS